MFTSTERGVVEKEYRSNVMSHSRVADHQMHIKYHLYHNYNTDHYTTQKENGLELQTDQTLEIILFGHTL